MRLVDNLFVTTNILGANLVNGIQCVYTNDTDALSTTTSTSLRYTSPLFTSSNDHPVAHVFDLSPGDTISRVVVRHGSLVDSISLSTRGGATFSAGGNGGGESSVVGLCFDTSFVV
jgi:hypothetical protein